MKIRLVLDRGIGKTPETAKKCSVHPKFVGKSEKSVPNSKKKQSGLSWRVKKSQNPYRISASPRSCKEFSTFLTLLDSPDYFSFSFRKLFSLYPQYLAWTNYHTLPWLRMYKIHSRIITVRTGPSKSQCQALFSWYNLSCDATKSG